MGIQRKPFIKWSIITVVCGGHSFFWGWQASNGAYLPMLLGMLTLVFALSYIESQPFYQNKRTAKPVMVKALDWGVRIRLLFAIYIMLSFGLQEVVRIPAPFEILGAGPFLGEIFIGVGAIQLTDLITGIKLESQNVAMPMSELYIATYLTTIFTAVAHTLILGVISGLVYVFLRVKRALCKPKTV